jgi:hypothetical protein
MKSRYRQQRSKPVTKIKPEPADTDRGETPPPAVTAPLPYGPRDSDLDYQAATLLLYPHVVAGTRVFIKWTCPACGERVTADDPMRLHPTGQLVWRPVYQHTERDDGSPCGHTVDVYTYRFGCMLVMSTVE